MDKVTVYLGEGDEGEEKREGIERNLSSTERARFDLVVETREDFVKRMVNGMMTGNGSGTVLKEVDLSDPNKVTEAIEGVSNEAMVLISPDELKMIRESMRSYINSLVIQKEEGIEVSKEVIGEFKEGLDAAAEFASEFGANTPIQNVDPFEALGVNIRLIMGLLMEKFGVDVNLSEPVRTYRTTGTKGSRGEGDIWVKVYATNDPDVFIGKSTDAANMSDWTIRPLEIEDE